MRGKRKTRYGADTAINDIYLLGGISEEDFKNLERFKNDRNKCIHEISKKEDSKEIEQNASELFEKHKDTYLMLAQKYEDELTKA